MDIRGIIPNKDKNWEIRNNILYYRKYGMIPLANIIDDELYICLDRRCVKPFISLIMYCENEKIDYLFCDRTTITEKHIYNENLQSIISNTLMCIEEDKFFDLIVSGRFDYIEILTRFLNLYDCHTNFKEVYEKLKSSHFERSWMDWFANKNYFVVKREDVREYYQTIEREIKLSVFLS